jgi:hypothetical protein
MSLSRLSSAAVTAIKGDPVPVSPLVSLVFIMFVVAVGMLPSTATLTTTYIATVILERDLVN